MTLPNEPSNVQDAFMNATMPNGIGSRLDEGPAAQKEADRLWIVGKAVDLGWVARNCMIV